MTVFEIYDAEGDFVCMLLDENEAYEYAQQQEAVPNTWEVRKTGRESHAADCE